MRIPFTNWTFERRSSEVQPISADQMAERFARGVYPGSNYMKVNEISAMQTSAVMACVRIIAETVASLPLHTYKRLMPRGRERTPAQISKLLNSNPNVRMTAFTFREMMMAHLLLWGNCYAEIEYDRNGNIVALWPLPPSSVTVRKDADGAIFYDVTVDAKSYKLPAYAVFHIPGLGFDGLKGFSPIQMSRRTIGLTIAAEEFGENFYRNGTNTGGFFTKDGALSDPAYERLKKDLQEKYEGLGNAHRVMLLEEGLKYESVGIPPDDAQFLETRKFQIGEIARLFRVPPHMIGDLERATFSNIEQQSIGFVIHTIRPWLVRWEQTINWKLFGEDERKRLYAEFLIEGLLRGDSQARATFYKEMFMIGAYSQNDIREKENDNPIQGGDRYFVPLNMVPVDMLDEVLRAKGGDKKNEAGTQIVQPNGNDAGNAGAGSTA